MRRRVVAMATLGAASLAMSAVSLMGCPDDPREGEKVIVKECNAEGVAELATTPGSVEAALRSFLETSAQLLQATKDADAALRDACLAVVNDPELGLIAPPNPTSANIACGPILEYIQKVVGNQPPQKGLLTVPQWIELRFGQRCTTPPGTKEACLSQCSGPCDVSKCTAGKIVGRCPGQCLGVCTKTERSDAGKVACHGSCVGEIPMPSNALKNPGQFCLGECEGTCGGAIYVGNCEGSCANDFVGKCGGTCNGTCDGTPVGQVNDAGDNTKGPLDGSVNDFDPYQPPFDDGTGIPNCPTGQCKGTCSKKAYGTCYSRCVDFKVENGAYTTTTAPFKNGQCVNSVCIGTCRTALGSGAAQATGNAADPQKEGECYGECTELAKPARGQGYKEDTDCTTGICRPIETDDDAGADAGVDGGDGGGAFCDTDLDPASRTCEGRLECGQSSVCDSLCEAKAALAAKCDDPLSIQAYAVTAPLFDKVIKRHGDALARAVAKVRQAQAAYAFIGGTRYADFVTLDGDAGTLKGRSDLASKCAQKGADDLAAANTILAQIAAVDPTIVRFFEKK